MDLVGTIMGFVTIPMALLSVASLCGGAALLGYGAWEPVLLGIMAFGLCYGLAIMLEQMIIKIDSAAIQALNSGNPYRGRAIAAISGGLPMLILLGWELGCLHVTVSSGISAPRWILWLWSYGVATGPWTVFAHMVSRFRRTLCAIRAYAGHIAYWLLSATVLLGHVHGTAIFALMLVPAILPFVVGVLLALADRDALTNVRV